MFPFPCVPQVSNILDALRLCCNNIYKVERGRPGSFYTVFDPPCKGVKITKIAITPDNGVRLLRPSGETV